MELSLPGLVGAVVGAVIGYLDYGLIGMLVRRAIERLSASDPGSRPSQAAVDRVMLGVFVVNMLVFAGLGYWFGAVMGGPR